MARGARATGAFNPSRALRTIAWHADNFRTAARHADGSRRTTVAGRTGSASAGNTRRTTARHDDKAAMLVAMLVATRRADGARGRDDEGTIGAEGVVAQAALVVGVAGGAVDAGVATASVELGVADLGALVSLVALDVHDADGAAVGALLRAALVVAGGGEDVGAGGAKGAEADAAGVLDAAGRLVGPGLVAAARPLLGAGLGAGALLDGHGGAGDGKAQESGGGVGVLHFAG